MVELSQFRKNKVVLDDYDFQRDLNNRLLMTQFNETDLETLDEILYNTTKIPLQQLIQDSSFSEDAVVKSLEKLSSTDLLTIENQTVLVDKEMRKYYELQALRFDDDFKPDLDFLHSLLKQVPIHILPNWYSISRTSDSIFDSIIERYFQTPQIYQRYISELSASDPLLGDIIRDVFQSPQLFVKAETLQEKYELTKDALQKHILYLEYNFAVCASFRQINGHWIEVITPFYEWKQYLSFIQETTPKPIQEPDAIEPKRPGDFSFIRDMTAVLRYLERTPIHIEIVDQDFLISQDCIEKMAKHCGYFDLDGPIAILEAQTYLTHIIEKLCLIHLANCLDGELSPSKEADHWFSLEIEAQAHHLYRHPMNQLISTHTANDRIPEKSIREAEKAIKRVSKLGWVYYDDFSKGLLIPLNDNCIITLKKAGRSWRYSIPEYTENDKALIKAVTLEWLYEAGMVNVGTHQGKDCFCVTDLGRSFFED